MDPSFMKFLEDDEDESMHSGAAVDAFTAALNRDIEGGLSVAAHRSDPDVVGESSHGKSPGPMQLPGHWQSSTDDNLSQQSQQNESLHLHSSEQQLSQTEQIEQGSSAIDQHEHASNQPESGQRLLHSKQSHSDHQQLQPETNSFQLVEKDQAKNPELNPVQEPKLERTQHSESQRQPATQQLNNQQVSGSNDANNPIRRMRTAPTIPFHMLIPILRPNLDKDRSMQLHSVFSKLRSSEIGKEDFLRVIRNIVGDQMLRQAAHKVQLQLQAEAAQNQQTNPNQYSLQAQTASQQISSRGAQFMSHPASSQNQKGQKSPPRQPHVPPPSVQMQTGTEFPNLENSGTRSREVENKQDVKGMHTTQMYSTNMNVINSERQNLSVPLPGNKQQHGQLPQTSFSMFGNTAGNFPAQAYSRPSVSSTTTSLKPEAQISQMRQASQAQGIGSTHSGVMNAPKYELQNTANETKRLHSASLTSRAFPSMGYVKQEVVENPVEPSQKFQFSAPDGSFGSVHIDNGNPTLGSLKDDRLEKQSSRIGFSTSMSTTGPYQVSGAMSTPAETNMQSEGNSGAETEKEKDENRSKTVKVNREEDDKMRTTAANVAARAAVGGDDMLTKWQLMAEQARQKRDGVDVGSTSQPSKTANRKTLPTFSKSLREQQETEKKGPSAGGTRKMARNQAVAPEARVACNISVKDVIAALEREPQMSKSELIYRLYEKWAGDSAAE